MVVNVGVDTAEIWPPKVRSSILLVQCTKISDGGECNTTVCVVVLPIAQNLICCILLRLQRPKATYSVQTIEQCTFVHFSSFSIVCILKEVDVSLALLFSIFTFLLDS